MIIKADKEGQKAIAELVDICLKSGGLQVYGKINNFLAGVQPYEEPVDSPDKDDVGPMQKDPAPPMKKSK